MTKLVSEFSPRVWKPLTLEHIAPQPMTFNSKAELRTECKKRGVTCDANED